MSATKFSAPGVRLAPGFRPDSKATWAQKGSNTKHEQREAKQPLQSIIDSGISSAPHSGQFRWVESPIIVRQPNDRNQPSTTTLGQVERAVLTAADLAFKLDRQQTAWRSLDAYLDVVLARGVPTREADRRAIQAEIERLRSVCQSCERAEPTPDDIVHLPADKDGARAYPTIKLSLDMLKAPKREQARRMERKLAALQGQVATKCWSVVWRFAAAHRP